MTIASLSALAAACICGVLALAVTLIRKRSLAGGLFVVGILFLGVESLFSGLGLQATSPVKLRDWETFSLIVGSFVPAVWLAFSLAYSRGDARGYLRRWKWILLGLLLVPPGIALGFRSQLVQEIAWHGDEGGGWWLRFAPAVKILNVIGLASSVAILANIEKTFRAAIGTMQWRIKFVALGVGTLFGARIYLSSQMLLLSMYEFNLAVIQTTALIMGCFLIVVAYARRGFAEIDIYPSGAVLQNSVTILLAGGYLVIVGALGQFAASFGRADNLHLHSLVVLFGVLVLAILLLSDRLRQRMRRLVSQHFRRPMHDSRAIWTHFTRELANVFEAREFERRTVKLLAETFSVLSVTAWSFDEPMSHLTMGASTAALPGEEAQKNAGGTVDAPKVLVAGLQSMAGPFDPDAVKEPWGELLRSMSPGMFSNGGRRVCIPLFVGERGVGLIMLADRVNGVPYLLEELDLLRCIGDHAAVGLHQLRLTEELMQGRELAAFQAMSTFFVHDLKNAASSLTLMLENLPRHFDDPAFREDALRAIGGTVGRINQIIGRLGTLRQKLELRPIEVDLNCLIDEAIGSLGGFGKIEVAQTLRDLPPIVADRGQLENVVINLLANAREAVGASGRIEVKTERSDDWVVLSVADDGCGMSPSFIRDSLFRPFQTTKKKGLGIGMFQSKLIVEAHQGTLNVRSEPGRGTTFSVALPLSVASS
jgi:putative PEP-CTERM system histidine kinase